MPVVLCREDGHAKLSPCTLECPFMLQVFLTGSFRHFKKYLANIIKKKIGYQSEGEEEVLWERHEQGQLVEAGRKKGKGEVTQMHFNSKHLEILNP